MTPARSIQLADAVLDQLKAGTFQDGPSFERQIHPILKRENLDKLKGLVVPRGDTRTSISKKHRAIDYVTDIGIYQAVDGPESQLDDRLSPLVKCTEEINEYMGKLSRRELTLTGSYGVTMTLSEVSNGGLDLFWRQKLDEANCFMWILRLTHRGFEMTA